MKHTRSYGQWLLAWGPPIIGGVLLVRALVTVPPPSLPLLAVLAGLAVLAEYLTIPLPQSGYQSFGPTVTLPAIVFLGPGYAALIAAAGMAFNNTIFRHRPGLTFVFNTGQRTLSVLLAGVTWNALQSGHLSFSRSNITLGDATLVPAVVGSISVYILATHLQVSAFSAAKRQLSFWSILTGNALIRVATTAVLGASGFVITVMLLGAPAQLAGVEYVLIPVIIAEVILLLHASRTQTTRQLIDVHGAVTGLLQTLDLEEVLNRLADTVQQITKPDMLWIALRGSDGTDEITVGRGIGPDRLRRAAPVLARGASRWVVTHRRPLRIVDYERDPHPLIEESATAFLSGQVRAVMLVPLMVGNEPVGALTATKSIPDYFTEHQESAVAMFATQAALVVNNARLYRESQQSLARVEALEAQNVRLLEEAKHKAHQLALLNHAVTRIAEPLRPHELLDTLAEELHTTFSYPLVTLGLREGDQMKLVAHRGYDRVEEMRPLADGTVGRVVRTGKAALVTDVSRDPDYHAGDPRITQEACAPIISDERVVGVINVAVIAPTLTLTDVDLLTTLAGSAAVAIGKAQLYEQTQELASTDGLTGLLNYRAFWQALERELERSMRYGLPLSLIMIEIDKFKRYNDTYGHLRGDEVIRLVARVLTQERRAQIDIVARYGGDEFMILLPHSTKAVAAAIAERIRRAVQATPLISEVDVASVTLSVGVAGYPEDGKSPDALVDAVDRFMYKAKSSGGNAVAMAKSS